MTTQARRAKEGSAKAATGPQGQGKGEGGVQLQDKRVGGGNPSQRQQSNGPLAERHQQRGQGRGERQGQRGWDGEAGDIGLGERARGEQADGRKQKGRGQRGQVGCGQSLGWKINGINMQVHCDCEEPPPWAARPMCIRTAAGKKTKGAGPNFSFFETSVWGGCKQAPGARGTHQ